MKSASNAIQNTLAIDPTAVSKIRAANRADSAEGTKAVAQQFEALLMQQMLSAMRSANPTDGMNQSSGVEMFRGMHDQQLTQMWSSKGSLGLADMIARQIQVQQNPSLLKQVQRRGADPFNARGFDFSFANKMNPLTAKSAATLPSVADKAVSAVGDFLGKLSGVAQTVAADLGVAPHILLAHAALETGWGKKTINDAAGKDSFNLFGIKAGSSWKGKTTDVLTTEFVDGVSQKRIEKFRAYDSYAEAFADYASLMKKRFGDALGQGGDAIGFAKALAKDGYATDPQYAQKLARVADSVAARLGVNNSRLGA
ncbi:MULTISPECIES: flagellar assembly peptidoglycan hydrolase FlgJ [Deefgea]|uniref:Peptidoglycan hydrolase FlgJ n=1 Tax=Deefgea chitinilytica TaxID=570276 RepID=A0ABS2CBH1_9NEIS|nr:MULTISPECIES: flagellar assembly peptidoglycan hydrolase FlgJ [Deefgea]MBM5571372.1 flagellar assembly peptidoglycan hydrolase FlgJ [Deefgea chitinilytica]MBM9888605.1 flagellar assembly peptidoglycan hydrolase FlgJ [Deefgea sp. CFH1-16]